MTRFEQLTSGISQVNKKIQKIKMSHMSSLGLKGAHVMCLYFLSQYEEGLTAVKLCEKCGENKAAISRIMHVLEEQKLIEYPEHQAIHVQPSGKKNEINSKNKKRYNAKAVLTEKGRQSAGQVYLWLEQAVRYGSEGITPEEEEVFYRILFKISSNLSVAIEHLEHGNGVKE